MTRQRTHLRKKYPDLKEGLPKTPEQQLSASDTKELARLVVKYGLDRIVATAKEVPLPRRGRPPRDDLPLKPEGQLSGQDEKVLARLVSKYERDTIVSTAKEIPLPRRGRPPRGDLPYYERMHLADWIKERAEEYAHAGSPKPVTNALIDAYDMLYEGEHAPPDLQKFLKTHKKKFHIGRRELQEVREAQQRKQEWLQKQKEGRK